ncbi:MAG TPA: hypothetical protein PK252_08660 [Bacteroidales bacterium]|nr:hypothetical protein [Bacteroidales bacterium]
MKKNINTILAFKTIFIILFICIFFNSCDKEEIENESITVEYLSISNLNTKSQLTKAESDILKKAKERINKSLKFQNGKLSLAHVTAKDLNMSEDIFNLFQTIVTFCNEAPHKKKVEVKSIKVKSASTENSGAVCDVIGDAIEACAGSDFEKECFRNYWDGKGDKTLSYTIFIDIVKNVKISKTNNWIRVDINGKTYYQCQASFYDNSKYDYALGTCTMYYDANGNAVGMKDTYDFNPENFGVRSSEAEVLTRTINTLGGACGAKNYEISYGIHK